MTATPWTRRNWTKRQPPDLTDDRVEAFQKLQKTWDKKLRRSGFKDLEQGFDLADYNASTFRTSDDTTHGPSFQGLSTFDLESDDPTRLEDTEQFQYWAVFSARAMELHDTHKRKAFLRSVAEAGNLRKALLSRHKIDKSTARRAIARFCADAGIPVPRFHRLPEKKEPAPPVRVLDETERKLYEAELLKGMGK